MLDEDLRDTSPEIVRGYGERIRYIRQQNRGVAAARNAGVGAAACKVLAFIDADDLVDSRQIVMAAGGIVRSA